MSEYPILGANQVGYGTLQGTENNTGMKGGSGSQSTEQRAFILSDQLRSIS